MRGRSQQGSLSTTPNAHSAGPQAHTHTRSLKLSFSGRRKGASGRQANCAREHLILEESAAGSTIESRGLGDFTTWEVNCSLLVHNLFDPDHHLLGPLVIIIFSTPFLLNHYQFLVSMRWPARFRLQDMPAHVPASNDSCAWEPLEPVNLSTNGWQCYLNPVTVTWLSIISHHRKALGSIHNMDRAPRQRPEQDCHIRDAYGCCRQPGKHMERKRVRRKDRLHQWEEDSRVSSIAPGPFQKFLVPPRLGLKPQLV